MAPPNNRLMIKTTTVVNRFLFQVSNGRIGGRFGKAEILLLTTKGRKSGQARTIPLQYFRDDDDIVLVPSNAGDDHHPGMVVEPAGESERRCADWRGEDEGGGTQGDV